MKKRVQTPGPGAYRGKNEGDWKKQTSAVKKEASMFASWVKREPYENIKSTKIPKKHPGVGTYNVEQGNIEYNLKANLEKSKIKNPLGLARREVEAPFNSKIEWFAELKPDASEKFLGPGYYEHETHIGLSEKERKLSSRRSQKPKNFNTTQKRFGETVKDNPGPGEYEGDNQRWFKKSFNMIFAE